MKKKNREKNTREKIIVLSMAKDSLQTSAPISGSTERLLSDTEDKTIQEA